MAWPAKADLQQRLLGLALLGLAALGGWWVETDRAETLGVLELLRRSARSAPLDRLDAALEGQPVHAVGAVTSARLVDDLGVVAEALRLERVVLMYQWKEVEIEYEDSDGNTRTRRECREVWSSEPGDCCSSHPNPHMVVRSASYVAGDARLGPYRLTRAITAQAPLRPYLTATPPHLKGLPLRQVDQGWHYGDPDAPGLGDLQVDYLVAAPPATPGVAESELTYSFVAAQRGDALVPWVPPGGGEGLVLIAPARAGVDELVDAAVDAASAPWGWRVLLLVVAWFGAQYVLVTLSWREDVVCLVASTITAPAIQLGVAALVWREQGLGLTAAVTFVTATIVTVLGTRRR